MDGDISAAQALLHYSGGEYVWSGGYDTRHLPKEAGFRWNPAPRKIWTTKDPAKALRVAEYAAPDCRAEITARTRVAATEAEAAIAASHAKDAEIAIPCPDGLAYLPYQRAGIAYALARRDTLIADEPGTGKTIQTCGVLNVALADAARPRVLIVCPKIMLTTWCEELAKWLVKPLTIGVATAKDWPDADIVVINYDILAKCREGLLAVEWDWAVFDESHYIKEKGSQRTKAALGGGRERMKPIPAKRRLFLTGTPILNRPKELYTVLHAMGVGMADDYYRFTARFCGGYQDRYGWRDDGATNLPELQAELRKSVMIRRLKSDVLTELPPKRWVVVSLPMDAAARRAVADERKAIRAWKGKPTKAEKEAAKAALAEDQARGKSATRAAMSKLVGGTGGIGDIAMMAKIRHRTALAKVASTVEHVVEILRGGEQSILVFAHHLDVIAAIADGLRESGYDPAVIVGGTPTEERMRIRDSIQSGECRVAVLGIKACGVGLTLHKASVVVFAEQDWSPEAMKQCEDRTHRVGQSNPVIVQYLILDGTFDAAMARKVAAKSGVIDAALDASIEIDGECVDVSEIVAGADADAIDNPSPTTTIAAGANSDGADEGG